VLLARAGEFFRRLTAGAYPRLRPDTDGGKHYLEVIDENEQRKRVDALSEGTRDQLYFALRLATLEQHFGNNEAMPLILDDTFVAFDDRRSVLAFEVLAEFAKTTQVIYFTHHNACVEAARAAIPAGLLHVHELEDRWTCASSEPASGLGVGGTAPLEQPQRLIPHGPNRRANADHAVPAKPRNVS
jgi:uncharacterized protein YhaN